MIEPKIGEIFSLHGMMVKTCPMKDNEHCKDCAFAYLECDDIICYSISREDSTRVIFKEVEQTKIKPMEVKIQIPDNCELIKDGDTYVVREKKQEPPRSWKEFCEKYPVKKGEAFIDCTDLVTPITLASDNRDKARESKCWCTSKEEAEAFLALMQLRQLRKAWVEDEKEFEKPFCIICRQDMFNKPISVVRWNTSHRLLSFPSEQMAKDFLNCFRDLCETAKILL